MRPNAEDVYRRLLVLKAVVGYAFASPPGEMLKEAAAQWSKEQCEKFNSACKAEAEAHVAKLRESGLWEYATPEEKKFLSSYGFKMDAYAHVAAAWRMECVGMLMWALGLIDKWPAIDDQIDPKLLKTIPPPAGYKARLRSSDEISQKRDLIEFWHWRVRTRQLIEERRPLRPDEHMKKLGIRTYDDIVRQAAKSGLEQGGLTEILEEDFVFRGKPFRALSSEEFSEAASIIMERHYALNWLCGLAPKNRWDETPTET